MIMYIVNIYTDDRKRSFPILIMVKDYFYAKSVEGMTLSELLKLDNPDKVYIMKF